MDGGPGASVRFQPAIEPDIDGWWYVSTPYSKYKDGLDVAAEMACRLTAVLVDKGFPVLSPIAHSHAVAMAGGLDPLDFELWMAANRRFMESAYGLIVIKMPGWEESVGMTEEIATFRAMEKPIHYLEVS